MKNHRIGFTLSEVLIALAVISVVLALSINAIKAARASYTSLAYFAFKNISNITGVLYSGTESGSIREQRNCSAGNPIPDKDKDVGGGRICPSSGKYWKFLKFADDTLKYKSGNTEESIASAVTHCRTGSGKYAAVLKNDKEWDSAVGGNCSERSSLSGTSGNIFCKAAAAVSNIAGAPDCSFLYAVTKGAEPSFDSSKFDIDKPNFTLTNGMRIYISDWTYDSENVSSDFGYRLAGVDLNGKSDPNKLTQTGTAKPADVVTFLVLDNGEVYPLGLAADNLVDGKRIIQYINAKVKGYFYSAYSARTNGAGARTGTRITREDNVTLEECRMKGMDSGYNKYKCNLGMVLLQNRYRQDNDKAPSNFSYRQALCSALGPKNSTNSDGTSKIEYIKYCSNKSYYREDKCPPSSLTYSTSCTAGGECPFDQCRVETVKPVFRYNLQ